MPQSSGSQTAALKAVQVPGVPFELNLAPGSAGQVEIVRAVDAVAPGELHKLTELGVTATGDGGLPGPSVRAVLDDEAVLGAQLRPQLGIEITDLAQVPTVLGTIATDGTFTEMPELTGELARLSGANPDDLYFEPQDATVHGDWVLWKEGSAGEHGAMPTLDFDDWRIVGWNKANGEVQEFGAAFLLHGERFAPRASWSAAPSTDGQDIYYEAKVPSQLIPGSAGDQWASAILRVPLGEPGAVEVVAPGTLPFADQVSPGSYWVNDNGVLVRNGTEVMEVLTAGWQIGSVVATSEIVTVVVVQGESPAWLLVLDAATLQLRAAIETGADWSEVSASAASVAWGNGTANSDPQMYLWQLGDVAPTRLGSTQGMSKPIIGGNLLSVPELTEFGAVVWSLQRIE
ncbi:hypothetical protein [Actinomyces minihominis]|uniref:hypothetical protein n=1 Tax=Actinomyces minihominis TaxID=2002838 RepID=UPI00101AD57F|nr:hypothetical protein [Actinomyces minihominis]